MIKKDGSRYILHVSDFHLTDDEYHWKFAFAALETLANKLKSDDIKIDYLLHTGDIIDSSDLYEIAAKDLDLPREYYVSSREKGKRFDSISFNNKATPKEKAKFNRRIKDIAEKRFNCAVKIMRKLSSRLNVSLGNVVICCGNHDILRPFFFSEGFADCNKESDGYCYTCGKEVYKTFEPFEEFLDNLDTANCQKRHDRKQPVLRFELDDLNILILNTNWKNPAEIKPGYYCVNCKQVRDAIHEKRAHRSNLLSIVLAHKPIYEICETARLSYKRYIKTPFMSDIQEFIGENGIYLCGDKHTRSIVGLPFHGIPHYIGGEPLAIVDNTSDDLEVEYNLLEISENRLGMERKVHLKYSLSSKKWDCRFRPQDAVVAQLYQFSKGSFIQNVLEIIAAPQTSPSWDNICQEIYSWSKDRRMNWFDNLDKLYKSICKYREMGSIDIPLDSEDINENIFIFIRNRLCNRIKAYEKETDSNNLLNVRGEYSSGKSTFLGLLYIFLLHEYSVGSIDFIPAYFNLENNELLENIHSNSTSYHDAVKLVFSGFANRIQEIADKEHQQICYIIDGLDEQDCWSYSSEDSIGRGLLDIIAKYSNIFYVLAFSQHRLPHFKNTMPVRTFSDTSDIIYFNPINVREKDAEDTRFVSFVDAFMSLQGPPERTRADFVESSCEMIRKFRRLTINPGFMYHNYNYISKLNEDGTKLKYENSSFDDTYRYYIDRQYEICLQKLGYGFIHYAPTMAYLFSYHGYTYEQFIHLAESKEMRNSHATKHICGNLDKIYDTFLFIKKQNDAREYLIALHYNRELRYYAEHQSEAIPEDSILNEFITRNISVLIRKLWSDTNKFIIVCERLLQRDDLGNCVQSELIYCLAHQDMYMPFRHRLFMEMLRKGKDTLQRRQIKGESEWEIKGEDSVDKLRLFIDLGLQHTMFLFGTKNNDILIQTFIYDESFRTYNRQHQMLYYRDLSIRGEEKRHALNPGNDMVYKGFDFHNCFNSLYVKLSSDGLYPLRLFDMCTMWDLIYSRLSRTEGHSKANEQLDTFFYREAFRDKAEKVLRQTLEIFEDHLRNNDPTGLELRYCRVVCLYLEKIIEFRNDTSSPHGAKSQKHFPVGFYDKGFWEKIENGDDEKWEKECCDTLQVTSPQHRQGKKRKKRR